MTFRVEVRETQYYTLNCDGYEYYYSSIDIPAGNYEDCDTSVEAVHCDDCGARWSGDHEWC